jgi:acyl transferase domain-containing protein/acyl carrier protein
MVGLSMADTERRLAGREHLLAVAASNGPTSSVVSGDASAVAALLNELEAAGIFCRRVNVDVASHSPQMTAAADALTDELAGLAPGEATLPLHSTLLGRRADGGEFDAAYWGRNLRWPVRFDTVIDALLAQGARCFAELGPHPVLSGAVLQAAQQRSLDVKASACGVRDAPEPHTALQLVACLWCAGQPIDWSAVLPRGQAHVDLPLYPWQRERHWCEAANQRAGGAGAARRGAHALLDQRFDPAGQDTAWWETTLTPTCHPYLVDHVVRGSVLFPAAAYLEAALAAAAQARPGQHWCLRDVEFHSAWALDPRGPARLQVRLHWTSSAAGHFEIHGLASGDGGEHWERRAGGRVALATVDAPAADIGYPATTTLHGDTLYAQLAGAGLEYGPSFRGLRTLHLADTSAIATIQLDADTIDPAASRYRAFPPLLDNVLQALAAVVLHRQDGSDGTPIPTAVKHFDLAAALPTGEPLTVALRIDHGDAELFDRHGARLGALRGIAFTHLRAARHDTLEHLLAVPVWTRTATDGPAITSAPVILVADAEATAAPLRAALGAAGMPAEWCPAHAVPQATRRLRDARQRAAARIQIVQLAGLECPTAEPGSNWIERCWQRIGDDTLELARGLQDAAGDVAPRVWLVTQGAVAATATDTVPALGAAALWGIGRVWSHEQPALDITLVDLEPGNAAPLTALLAAPPEERQLAWRAGAWHALRLQPFAGESGLCAASTVPSFEAALPSPGSPDSLHWRALVRRAPAAHEVEIEVEASGLNFMNLMSAMGVYPGYPDGVGPLGIEAAGRVVRAGAAISHVRPGDAVVAVGHALMQRHAVVDGELVARRPQTLEAAQAAGLPIAFLTAIYGLLELARLQRGERVLIHSAAGGVGLAALQVARRAGAEVLATAGTQHKRALLRSMGVQHVFDSRDGGFADAVLEATAGRGVDVVLNSLAGDLLVAGLRCVASHGRFVELGKRDIYGGGSIDLAPFRAGLSFFAVDLDRTMRERPGTLGLLLRQLVQDVDAGLYAPLPVAHHGADDLAGAFRALMPGTHVGKHVVALEPPPTGIRPAARLHSPVRADGCYLISGGLGALGLEVGRWLASRGAGALMLIGRSAPSAATRSVLLEIEQAGTRVLTASCDVADADALALVLAQARRDGGVLRGVFHAAGVLADGTLGTLTPDSLRTPRDSKALGAWHLDRLTDGDPLDCFVMFSSVASLFGTPGQGNYAAANAFLDALAHQRRARGRPALAINLGPIGDIGLALGNASRGGGLRRLGFDDLAAARAIDAIDRLLAADVAQAACVAFDPRRWLSAMGRDGAISLIDPGQRDGPPAAQPGLRESLETVPPGTPRRALLEAAIRQEVGAVLRLAPERIPGGRALKTLGLDSLMALELRNRLEKRSGVALSPALAWNHPTVTAMAEHLADQLHVVLDAAVAPQEAVSATDPPAADLDAMLDDLDRLTDEEARALIEREDRA